MLAERQRHRRSWHGPPHFVDLAGDFLLTAACYEHRPLIGQSPRRLAAFADDLLATVHEFAADVFAWVVLPNHYHVLTRTPDLGALLHAVGRLHGRTSFAWNAEQACRDRHVWHRVAETAMKSEGHFWATLNYILHNPVRHGYVERWQDWPYSNATA